MIDLIFVRDLTCDESNEILGRYEYPGWSVYSSLTDPEGAFGRREVRTVWEKDGRYIEDITPYPLGSSTCTHTEYRKDPDND